MFYMISSNDFMSGKSPNVTYTSWNSSKDFCGVKTFNKLMIWRRKEEKNFNKS